MPSSVKTRRVRTGCLTCRQRHLKCDEGKPVCLNCRRSSRPCDRGRRLNFSHYTRVQPLQYDAKSEWEVRASGFLDESVSIARLYKGGEDRYPAVMADIPLRADEEEPRAPCNDSVKNEPSSEPQVSSIAHQPPFNVDATSSTDSSTLRLGSHHHLDLGYDYDPVRLVLPPLRSDALMSNTTYGGHGTSRMLTLLGTQSPEVDGYRASVHNVKVDHGSSPNTRSEDTKSLRGNSSSVSSSPLTRTRVDPAGDRASNSGDDVDKRKALGDPVEIRYMTAFIDDMAGWMRAFDEDHVLERLFPHRAVDCHTIRDALLAYGASCVDNMDAAQRYYEAAAWGIRRFKCVSASLTDCPSVSRSYSHSTVNDENLTDVAAAAVVLYVYEMTTGQLERTSAHGTVARDLLRQGGWHGSSTGMGGACFRLFVVTEVLTCLAMNWELTCDPDTWGLDMKMSAKQRAHCISERDDKWVRQIFYFLAKVSDFRATASKFETPDMERMLGERQPQWRRLDSLCQAWHDTCPRTMRPFAYAKAGTSGVDSCFPLIGFSFSSRSGVVARIFYHTGRCFLWQTNPSGSADAMRTMELHHAQQICGIVATASAGTVGARLRPDAVVACCLAIAHSALVDPHEKDEAAELMRRNQCFSDN